MWTWKGVEKLSQKYWEGIWSIDRMPMEVGTSFGDFEQFETAKEKRFKKGWLNAIAAAFLS
jgi:hypothetical protein